MATLEEIIESWKLDSKIDETQLSNELVRLPSLHSKYLEYYIDFKRKHTKATSMRNKMAFKRKKYYRGEMTQDDLREEGWSQYQGLKMSNSEFNQHQSIDPVLVDLDTVVEQMSWSVKGVEYIMQNIKDRGYALKSLVEYQKFLAGN